MGTIWWNTPEATVAPNWRSCSQMVHCSAAVWCGTDRQMYLSKCHVLPRGHHANVKMIHKRTEMWCFWGSSVFGCSSLLFQCKRMQFLIWHLYQERALSLKKRLGSPLEWESSGKLLQRNYLASGWCIDFCLYLVSWGLGVFLAVFLFDSCSCCTEVSSAPSAR